MEHKFREFIWNEEHNNVPISGYTKPIDWDMQEKLMPCEKQGTGIPAYVNSWLKQGFIFLKKYFLDSY